MTHFNNEYILLVKIILLSIRAFSGYYIVDNKKLFIKSQALSLLTEFLFTLVLFTVTDIFIK